MSRKKIIFNSMKWGIVISLLHFVADLTGATLAIGWLFDPTLSGYILVTITAISSVFVGALLGTIIGCIYPAVLVRPIGMRGRVIGGILLVVCIATGAYSLRIGRQLPPLARNLQPASNKDSPPILWIVMDTLRANSLYGDNFEFTLAPKIGDFAKNALVFEDAESTAGWTIPSMAALMTGIHNLTMDASSGVLPNWTPTIAEHLHHAGYQTHALVDNMLLEPRTGFAAGFESFFQRSAFRFAFSLPAFRLLPESITMYIRRKLPVFYYGAPRLTEKAIQTINDSDSTPMFVYVHYMDPHAPYHAHPSIKPVPPDAEPINYYKWRDILREALPNRPTPGQQKHLRHRYNNEITYMSNSIDKLIRAWKHKFGNKGLIVLTSDHGEEFLEHGFLGHGHTVHRELVHVPLIIQFPEKTLPAQKSRGRIKEPVSLLNIVPTTLDAIGVSPTLQSGDLAIQGESLLPWLQDKEPYPNTPLLSTHYRHSRRAFRYRHQSRVYMKTHHASGKIQKAFFNLDSDPQEQQPMFSNFSAARKKLPAHVKQLAKEFEVASSSLKKARKKRHDTSLQFTKEALRAIGYVQ